MSDEESFTNKTVVPFFTVKTLGEKTVPVYVTVACATGDADTRGADEDAGMADATEIPDGDAITTTSPCSRDD